MRFWTANYMHASLDASALVGPVVNNMNVDMCIAVWIYMYSSSRAELGIGSLSIVLLGQNKNTTLWTLTGSQNSRWFYAQTSFRTTSVSDRVCNTFSSFWQQSSTLETCNHLHFTDSVLGHQGTRYPREHRHRRHHGLPWEMHQYVSLICNHHLPTTSNNC